MLPRLVDPNSAIGMAENAVYTAYQRDPVECRGSVGVVIEADPEQRKYDEGYPQERAQLAKIEEARVISKNLRAAKTVLSLS